jgi:hypothetical protein
LREISDELLMAYVDNEINQTDRERVETALSKDPKLRERIEVFQVSRDRLSELFNMPLQEPVPERLVQAVLYAPVGGARVGSARATPQTASSYLVACIAKLAGAIWELGLPRAMAAAGAIGIAGGMGWYAHDVARPLPQVSELASVRTGRLLAVGPLQRTLEMVPSNTRVALSQSDVAQSLRVVTSFKSSAGKICREFEVGASEGSRHVGLGCREPNGQWLLLAYGATTTVAVRKNGVETAAAPSSPIVDVAIERVIAGPAFSLEQEARAIANGWSME